MPVQIVLHAHAGRDPGQVGAGEGPVRPRGGRRSAAGRLHAARGEHTGARQDSEPREESSAIESGGGLPERVSIGAGRMDVALRIVTVHT
ncbi:hypothetical protein TTY48_37280 [Tsukamurella sp. TY48]|nr:hypothetical protein TTY48_37280 [Tsukamurella sp. TY48]